MKRVSLLALFAVGCVSNDNVIMSIVQNQKAQRISMCIVPSTINGVMISSGLLDVSVVEAGYDGYVLFPLVRNQLIQRPATTGSRDVITLMGIDVQLIPDGTLAAGLPSAARTYFVAGYGGSVDPMSVSVMAVTAIPRAQALLLGGQVKDRVIDPPEVILHYRAVADHAGDVVYSGWVDFPVRLCRGCLTGLPLGACPPAGFDDQALAKAGCLPQQDDGNLCCSASNGSVVCAGGLKLSQ